MRDKMRSRIKYRLRAYTTTHNMRAMNAIRYIRKNVFGVTQQEFAEIAGVQQSSVSRWETGGAPTLEEMTRIREAANSRKLKRKWRDDLFFTAPTEERAA